MTTRFKYQRSLRRYRRKIWQFERWKENIRERWRESKKRAVMYEVKFGAEVNLVRNNKQVCPWVGELERLEFSCLIATEWQKNSVSMILQYMIKLLFSVFTNFITKFKFGGINNPFLFYHISFTLFTFPCTSCLILLLLLDWLLLPFVTKQQQQKGAMKL